MRILVEELKHPDESKLSAREVLSVQTDVTGVGLCERCREQTEIYTSSERTVFVRIEGCHDGCMRTEPIEGGGYRVLPTYYAIVGGKRLTFDRDLGELPVWRRPTAFLMTRHPKLRKAENYQVVCTFSRAGSSCVVETIDFQGGYWGNLRKKYYHVSLS